MADDESVSHLIVFQVGPTAMMLKIQENYSFFLDDLNEVILTSAKNIFFSRVTIKGSVCMIFVNPTGD